MSLHAQASALPAGQWMSLLAHASALPEGAALTRAPHRGRIAGLMLLGQAADGARGWSKITRQRVSATFLHFFVSTLIWSGTALVCWKLGLVPFSTAALVVEGLVGLFLVRRLQRLDYDTDRAKKIITFYLFAALQGSVLSVLLLKCWVLGLFDVIVQAAVLTHAHVHVHALARRHSRTYSLFPPSPTPTQLHSLSPPHSPFPSLSGADCGNCGSRVLRRRGLSWH